jgi:putative ABC transport system permease protein
MFEHILKLMWNRRRSNALVILEIALAFLAAFAVLAMGVHYWTSHSQPLGFNYRDIWAVHLRTSQNSMQMNNGWSINDAYTLRSVLAAIRSLPNVEDCHVIRVTPFTHRRSNGPYLYENGRLTKTSTIAMTTGAPEALGMSLTDGRWFNETDEGQAYRAAVVNKAYVERAFGTDGRALGMNINQVLNHPPPGLDELPEVFRREVHIVGIVDHFRHNDLSDEAPLVLTQYELEHAPQNALEHPNSLLIKVAPDTAAGFEEQIISSVKSVASNWDVTIVPWEELRRQTHREILMPVVIGATLAVFGLLMVAMGLIGVIGLDVVRRTQEIGLRRAIGASASSIRMQIVVEQLLVGLIGVLCGVAIAIQLPLLDVVEQINWASTLPGIALAAVLVQSLVVVSAIYPSWVASRREPTDALRYE